MAQPMKKEDIKKQISMAKKVKQPKEELNLKKARNNMNLAWIKLDMAISTYNLYLENKLTNKNK